MRSGRSRRAVALRGARGGRRGSGPVGSVGAPSLRSRAAPSRTAAAARQPVGVAVRNVRSPFATGSSSRYEFSMHTRRDWSARVLYRPDYLPTVSSARTQRSSHRTRHGHDRATDIHEIPSGVSVRSWTVRGTPTHRTIDTDQAASATRASAPSRSAVRQPAAVAIYNIPTEPRECRRDTHQHGTCAYPDMTSRTATRMSDRR